MGEQTESIDYFDNTNYHGSASVTLLERIMERIIAVLCIKLFE